MTAVTSSSCSCCGSGDNFAFFAELCFVFALKTFAGTSCGTQNVRSVAQPFFENFFLQIHAIWLITNSHLGRQLVCNHFALFKSVLPVKCEGMRLCTIFKRMQYLPVEEHSFDRLQKLLGSSESQGITGSVNDVAHGKSTGSHSEAHDHCPLASMMAHSIALSQENRR